MIDTIIQLQSISLIEVIIRMALAMMFAFALGAERDHNNKPIGFRTYMIVTITTCMLTIMSQELVYISQDQGQSLTVDMTKLISGIMTGIGFLGAGAIIKVNNSKIIGSATGASIWASAAVGICLGFGLYGLAIITFITIFATLYIGEWFKNKF